jgi:hypothetical protein
MSGLNTKQFSNPNYPPEVAETWDGTNGAGPGFNVPNLLLLNLMPSSRLTTYLFPPSLSLTFELTALSHPNSSLPLAVSIINLFDPSDYFTVEYRQTDGWDAGLPASGVLIHEYKTGADPYSFLQLGGNNGLYQAGDKWTDPSRQVSVSIRSIDPTRNSATVVIGP